MNEHSGSKFSPEPRNIYITVPNIISLLRIVSIPFITLLVAHHRMVLALIVLTLSALSDGVDGLIARSFNQVSRIGQVLDPIADRLLILCSVLALGLAGIIPMWMIVIVAARDMMMGVLVVILAQHDYGPLPVNFVGKTGTALLLISIIVLIISEMVHSRLMLIVHVAGLATGIWGLGIYWLAGLIYVRQGYRLLSNQAVDADGD
mgnify:CR=1 FL=1